MVFLGESIETKNKGYFGIRYCDECGEFQDVELIEVKKVFRFFFFRVKTYAEKRFLCCKKCGASFEISPKLWGFYQTYITKRMNKKSTDEVLETLRKINDEYRNHNIFIDMSDSIYYGSLDTICDSLEKKYGNVEYLEEVMNVFFSNCNNQKNIDQKNENKQTN